MHRAEAFSPPSKIKGKENSVEQCSVAAGSASVIQLHHIYHIYQLSYNLKEVWLVTQNNYDINIKDH